MRGNLFFRIPAIVVFSFLFLSLQAQHFDSALNKLNNEYPQEKLYLQFDRSLYAPGEIIWSKAYLFSGNDLSLISRTVYADLFDEKGKLVFHKIAPVIGSGAAFSFELPENLTGSVVYIKAYTKWMLNFDSSFLYTKAIPLVETKKIATKTAASPPVFYLQFLPEGGDLVEGLESKVAFKATDNKGFPIRVNGTVSDSKGKAVTTFKSVHDGMGYFKLLPSAGEQYKASWKDEAGNNHITVLPAAQKNGVVLSLINNGEKLDFEIKRSEGSATQSVYVVAQTQQQLIYKARANLNKGPVINGSIPINSIPAGIVQVTLFAEDGKPLAERIAFANQQDYYFITDLNAPLKNLGKRKKNVIQIDVPDTLRCNLSIAVTDANLNPPASSEDNIFSHVLLAGDIRGYVHNPAYYFSSDADSVKQYLDLVMMTNGWRRFNWSDVLSNKWPVLKYKPEGYATVQGKVLGLNKTELANRDVTTIIQLKNGQKEFLVMPLNAEGTFTSPEMMFYDTAHIYYQLNNDKNRTLTGKANFSMKNNFIPDPAFRKPDSSWLAGFGKPDSILLVKNKEASKSYLEQLNAEKVKTLANVTITAKSKTKHQKMEEEYTSGLFRGGDAAATFYLEDDPLANSSQTVLSYLQGKVAGLQINMGAGTPTLTWRGGSPGLYMDELQTDVDVIEGISMSDVAMIKVFRPPFLGGFGGGSGAIAVYLKKGASRNGTSKGLDFSAITGYSPMKEFYSPDYDKADQANATDYRTTLYWSPFILTDKEHRRIQLSFFNNDVAKKFRVVIEGINQEGRLTRIEKVFE